MSNNTMLRAETHTTSGAHIFSSLAWGVTQLLPSQFLELQQQLQLLGDPTRGGHGTSSSLGNATRRRLGEYDAASYPSMNTCAALPGAVGASLWFDLGTWPVEVAMPVALLFILLALVLLRLCIGHNPAWHRLSPEVRRVRARFKEGVHNERQKPPGAINRGKFTQMGYLVNEDGTLPEWTAVNELLVLRGGLPWEPALTQPLPWAGSGLRTVRRGPRARGGTLDGQQSRSRNRGVPELATKAFFDGRTEGGRWILLMSYSRPGINTLAHDANDAGNHVGAGSVPVCEAGRLPLGPLNMWAGCGVGDLSHSLDAEFTGDDIDAIRFFSVVQNEGEPVGGGGGWMKGREGERGVVHFQVQHHRSDVLCAWVVWVDNVWVGTSVHTIGQRHTQRHTHTHAHILRCSVCDVV